LESEWIRALEREWDELYGQQNAQETTIEKDEEHRRAFDEAAARLFPRSRQDEMVRRMVRNRERFQRVTEARFQARRPQESWMFQTASESWGFRGMRG
jgi:hypothetical protein